MPDSDSPFRRPVRLRMLVGGLVAMAAVIAIGAAVHEGRIGAAIAFFIMLVVAVPLALWARRLRRDTDSHQPGGR